MPKIVDRKAKQRDILLAALPVLAQKGVANTRMIEIADAAGIGKGTIYEYFKDKDELFRKAFDLFQDELENVMARSIFRETDPIAKLKALIRASIDFTVDESTVFMDVMIDFWAEGVRNNLDNTRGLKMDELYHRYREMIGALLTEARHQGKIKSIDIHSAAATLIGALDGLMLQWFLDKTALDLKKTGEFLMNTFIDGILRENNDRKVGHK